MCRLNSWEFKNKDTFVARTASKFPEIEKWTKRRITRTWRSISHVKPFFLFIVKFQERRILFWNSFLKRIEGREHEKCSRLLMGWLNSCDSENNVLWREWHPISLCIFLWPFYYWGKRGRGIACILYLFSSYLTELQEDVTLAFWSCLSWTVK